MKKQLKRAIFCAICMVVVGVMCLTGVTYAWFTDSKSAVVDGIGIKTMTATGGILISLDPNGGEKGEGWKYELDMQINVDNFKPASTHQDTIQSDGTLRFFDADNDPAFPNVKIATKDVTSSFVTSGFSKEGIHYVKQDIYLNNLDNSEDVTVSLAGTKINIDTTNQPNTHWATRVAIVDHGTYKQGATYNETVSNAAAVKASTSGQVKIYENNSTDHLTGSTGYSNTYGVIAAKGDSEAGTYYNVDGSDNAGMVRLVETETEAADIKITVNANSCHKVTVYTWIEGQDVDCRNKTSGGDYGVEVRFTLPE